MGCNSSVEASAVGADTSSRKQHSQPSSHFTIDSLHDRIPTELLVHVLSFVSYAPRDHFAFHDSPGVKKRLLDDYKKHGGVKEKDTISHPLIRPGSMATLYRSYEHHQVTTAKQSLNVAIFCPLVHVIPLVCRLWRDFALMGSDQVLWRDACYRFIRDRRERHGIDWLAQSFGLDSSSVENLSNEQVLQSILDQTEKYKSPRQVYKVMFNEFGAQFYRSFVYIHPGDDLGLRISEPVDFNINTMSEIKAMENLLLGRPLGDQAGLPIHNGPLMFVASETENAGRSETGGGMSASLVRVRQCSMRGFRRTWVRAEVVKQVWISESKPDERDGYTVGIGYDVATTSSQDEEQE